MTVQNSKTYSTEYNACWKDYKDKNVKYYLSEPILKKPFPSEKYDYGNVRVEKLKNIIYPGRGKKKSKCLEFSVFECDCGHTTQIIRHSCNRIICPVCYQNAIKRQAMKTTERFIKIRDHFIKRFDYLPNYAHFTLNTMWQIRTSNSYKKYKKKLLKILKDNNMSGVLIFHPWRGKPILKFSPHFHFIGTGKMMNSDKFYEKYGFTYKKIRNLMSSKTIYGTLKYLLSHTGKFAGINTITWNNQFAYNKFKTTIKERLDQVRCQDCDSCLFLIINVSRTIKGNLYNGLRIGYDMPIKKDRETVLLRKTKKIKIYYRESVNKLVSKQFWKYFRDKSEKI